MDLHSELLATVFRLFYQHGEWPPARVVDAKLADRLDAAGGLQAVCRQIGQAYVLCDPPASAGGRARLPLAGMERVPEARTELDIFLSVVRFCGERYARQEGAVNEVRFPEIREAWGLSDTGMARLYQMLLLVPELWSGISGETLTLSPLALRLRKVSSVDDFNKRTESYIAAQRLPPHGQDFQPGPPKSVFLSHAAADADLAAYLASVLKLADGHPEVFVATAAGDIPPGTDWLQVIQAKLSEADCYLVLLTPESVTRLWIWFETGAAWMSGRMMIPLTAKGLAKAMIPWPLGAQQALSLERVEEVKQLFELLGVAVALPREFVEKVTNFPIGGTHLGAKNA